MPGAPAIDARTFRPSYDPRALLVTEPTTTPGPFAFSASAWLAYAHRPVALRDVSSGAYLRPLENQLTLDLAAGLGIGDRTSLGVVVPLALAQGGTAGLPSQIAPLGGVPAAAIGDVALGTKVALLRNEEGGPGLALLSGVTLPNGETTSFLGEGQATVSARLVADYSVLAAGVQASLGVKIRPEDREWPGPGVGGPRFGNEVPWSLAIRFRPALVRKALVNLDPDNRQTWEIAARGAVPAGPVAPFGHGAEALSPVLLSVANRVELGRSREVFLLFGVDFGLVSAVGQPAVRGVLGVGWWPRNDDADDDGVADGVDECPDLAEDRDGVEDRDGCPEDEPEPTRALPAPAAPPAAPAVAPAPPAPEAPAPAPTPSPAPEQPAPGPAVPPADGPPTDAGPTPTMAPMPTPAPAPP